MRYTIEINTDTSGEVRASSTSGIASIPLWRLIGLVQEIHEKAERAHRARAVDPAFLAAGRNFTR